MIVELTLAVSLYTYKDHLTSGLKKGLNQSLHNYGPSAVMQSADFDAMQENVKIIFYFKYFKLIIKFILSLDVVEIKIIVIGTI